MTAPPALAQVLVQELAQGSVQAPTTQAPEAQGQVGLPTTAAQVQVEAVEVPYTDAQAARWQVPTAAAQVPRCLAGPKQGEVVGQQEPESHLQVVRQQVGQEAHSARRQALQQDPRQELDMQAVDIDRRATPFACSSQGPTHCPGQQGLQASPYQGRRGNCATGPMQACSAGSNVQVQSLEPTGAARCTYT